MVWLGLDRVLILPGKKCAGKNDQTLNPEPSTAPRCMVGPISCVNGGTRDFEVYVSQDGKVWDLAHKGWLLAGMLSVLPPFLEVFFPPFWWLFVAGIQPFNT